jgi:hypothetical protein
MPARVMNYIESDAPAELTLAQWRRTRVTAPPPRRLRWVRTLFPVRPRQLPAPA